MAFALKVAWAIDSFVSHYFRANQMEFEEKFDNLAFKHMDSLRILLSNV